MKRLPLKVIWISSRSVNLISKKRMSLTCHVYPDLMCTSCFQPALHISGIPETLQNLIMGHCIFAVFVINGHFLTVNGMTPDGSFDPASIFFKVSTDDCPVPSFDRMLF